MNHQSSIVCTTPRSVQRAFAGNPGIFCGATLRALEVMMR